jgi:hypothetical protein
MSLVKHKKFRTVVGLFGLGAVLFTLYKAYRHFFRSEAHTNRPNQETQPDIILSSDS